MKSFLGAVLFYSFLVAQAYSATFYVSPDGDDSKTGLTIGSAWKTINKVNSIDFRAGDQILFEGGSTFAGGLSFDNNDTGNEANPIIISSYGNGRAVIVAGTQDGLYAYNTAGMEIKELNFIGNGYLNNSNNGIFFLVDLPGGLKLRHVYIDNCESSGFGGSGIKVWGINSGYDDVRITNCSAHDNLNGITGSGLYKIHGNLYIGDCKAYDNPGNQSNTGSGILASGFSPGIIEYCEAYNNGYGNTMTGGGPVGIWVYRADSITIQYCISHGNKTGPNGDGWDGGGFDIDGGSTNCTIQYCYSYENYGYGFMIGNYDGAPPQSNNTLRYNISENDGRKNSNNGIDIWNPGGTAPPTNGVKIYNNVVYSSRSKVEAGSPGCVRYKNGNVSNIVFYNNIFIAEDGVRLLDIPSDTGEFTFRNNLYWSTGTFTIGWAGKTYTSLAAWRSATGQERLSGNDVGIQADPNLVNPGDGEKPLSPRSLAGLNAYKQQAGSPCKDTGLDLRAVFGIFPGLRDFYGNTIFHGAGYDIGAYESAGSGNQSPAVDAGANKTITLPTDTVSLDATVIDPDDTPSTTWSKQAGPGTITFGNGGQVDTTASFSKAGTYLLGLEAYDGTNAPVSDKVVINVNPVPIGDADADGIDDAWEATHFGDPINCAPGADPDSDGLTNLEEYNAGADPNNSDTDADGILDGKDTDLVSGTSGGASTSGDKKGGGCFIGDISHIFHQAEPAESDTQSPGAHPCMGSMQSCGGGYLPMPLMHRYLISI